MSKTKKQYAPQFKAKVALAAVERLKSIAELSGEYKIHLSVLSKWKRKLIDESTKIFEREVSKQEKSTEKDAEINELYRQIGKLKVEKDFLAHSSARLGLPITTVHPLDGFLNGGTFLSTVPARLLRSASVYMFCSVPKSFLHQ